MNPIGDYTFSGLGFTFLRFLLDGSQYFGYLYYGEGSYIAISGATFTNTTGAVTFSAEESPAGVRSLYFTGSVITDQTGNVTGIVGSWTGISFIALPPEATAKAATPAPVAAAAKAATPAPVAATRRATVSAESAIRFPIVTAYGNWAATDRQDIIM